MAKYLGLDLGSGSIGIAVRNTDKGRNDIKGQLDYFGSIVFPSGVGKGKSGEFSYAAARTKKRMPRHTLRSRKQRIWATLALLIEMDCTPLTLEQLDRWRIYDKSKGLKRQYPIDEKFEQWVRLDFNGDGIADYSSPYQLRAELMERQINWDDKTDRLKLGRAIYHIAQHRGFKSSKGETLTEMKENEKDDIIDISAQMKASENKKSKDITEYMKVNHLKTIGQAFARLEKEGVRIRENTKYQAVRSQYKEEISAIFDYQDNLRDKKDFLNRLISEKKNIGTIFYKKPLKSQKGNVAKCLLEPKSPRCPISHPEFEKFRALSFLNNIKYRLNENDDWKTLTLEQKNELFRDKFMRLQRTFKFEEITKHLSKRLGVELYNDNLHSGKTINYRNDTSVSGCPTSARLRKILGEDWECAIIKSSEMRTNTKTGKTHTKQYDYLSLWNLCFSTDESEDVERIAQKIGLTDSQVKDTVRLWGDIQDGYANLSLKAIRKINRMLKQGFRYDEAVLFAKIPDILGSHYEKSIDLVIKTIRKAKELAEKTRITIQITNTLIAKWKNQPDYNKVGFRNTSYQLDDDDRRDIFSVVSSTLSTLKHNSEEEIWFIQQVQELYQNWFKDEKRSFLVAQKTSDIIKDVLSSEFPEVMPQKWEELYHHSMYDIYPAVKPDSFGVKHLDTPSISAIKNPMAMRILHTLRRTINNLIDKGVIDEDTHIVVEMAREINDKNWRDAINDYQKSHEKENKFLKNLIEEQCQRDASKDDIDKCRLLMEQADYNPKDEDRKWKQDRNLLKYKLWKEQDFRCIYTGKIITLADLFAGNKYDIEHTIPRSISFDNSMSNLTVCDADFNRNTKKNKMPSELPNYQEIKTRIEPWKKKLERIESNIQFWKDKSKKASTKDTKDESIRQRHFWELERDYWRKKVNSFETTDYNDEWRNNQLNDTRIISKYALHYLKTLFNHVTVANGKYTSDFRKMLGVQSLDEKKDREKHSHHAIDAAVLSLMPNSQKRKEMLELFYKKEELNYGIKNGWYQEPLLSEKQQQLQDIKSALNNLIASLDCGTVAGLREHIENNILVNHIHKDQALTPTSRRWRIRGKIVPLRDSDGNIVREADGTPKAKRWIKGDIIRGQLHEDTYYGAIKKAIRDDNGKLLHNKDGDFVFDEKLSYVCRKPLKYKSKDTDTGFKDWDELKKEIVDKDLYKRIKEQFDDNISFKEAVDLGIYMTNRDGERIHIIRKVRAFANSVKNPLKIKKQTYLSKKEYKHHYYAKVGDLYALAIYIDNESMKKEYDIFCLFDISENKKYGFEPIPSQISKKNKKYILETILRKGDVVLIYKNTKEELVDLDSEQLQKRLYKIVGFENDGNDGNGRINLINCLNAQDLKSLGKGESIKDFNNLPQKIRQGISSTNLLIKGKDFELDRNRIIFKT
ncbi:MAG: hypothetical protein IJR32_01640 [Paludibacteraceae bacterium]|nr:hypothetical protein [Paludibacteraceae bacterium]